MDEAANKKRADLIIKRIQERRIMLNLSYQALADRTGLSKSTLQRYETGDIMNIPLSRIDVLANGLQISPLYLMGWQDKPDYNDVNENDTLTPDEKNIILIYRKLDDRGKDSVRSTLKREYSYIKKEPPKKENLMQNDTDDTILIMNESDYDTTNISKSKH